MFFMAEVLFVKRAGILAILSLATLCPSPSAPAQEIAKSKKLIEWGWDEPDTKFMRENIQKMEQLPFDGVVFHVIGEADEPIGAIMGDRVSHDKGSNFCGKVWGSRRFELAAFQQSIEDLKATPFRRLTDRFLRLGVSPGDVDWFDDQAWAVVIQNFTVAAQIAKQGGCKGFLFDVEQYGYPLFAYEKQKHSKTKTFAEYEAKVHQRAHQWMEAVNAQFPDITILVTYMYTVTGRRDKMFAIAEYGLMAGFLDGMLDACSPQTKIVDMWEHAYRYKQKEQFIQSHDDIRVEWAKCAGDPDKYRRHVQAGFGIWMDADRGKTGWHMDDVAKHFFTPAQFEASDEYVWIYTEKPSWWTNQWLPKPYLDALQKARDTQNLKPSSK